MKRYYDEDVEISMMPPKTESKTDRSTSALIRAIKKAASEDNRTTRTLEKYSIQVFHYILKCLRENNRFSFDFNVIPPEHSWHSNGTFIFKLGLANSNSVKPFGITDCHLERVANLNFDMFINRETEKFILKKIQLSYALLHPNFRKICDEKFPDYDLGNCLCSLGQDVLGTETAVDYRIQDEDDQDVLLFIINEVSRQRSSKPENPLEDDEDFEVDFS